MTSEHIQTLRGGHNQIMRSTRQLQDIADCLERIGLTNLAGENNGHVENLLDASQMMQMAFVGNAKDQLDESTASVGRILDVLLRKELGEEVAS